MAAEPRPAKVSSPRASKLELRSEPPLPVEDVVAGAPAADPVLRARARQDLAARGRTGNLAYLALAAIVIIAAPIAWQHEVVFGAGMLALVIVRGLAIRGTARGRRHDLAIATVGIGALWGAFAVSVLVAHERDSATLLVLMCVAGVAAGATTSLSIDRRLHAIYTILLLVPSTIELAVSARDKVDLGLLAMFLCFLGYLLAQGRRSHREYWHGLATARMLELLNERIAAASAAKSGFLADMSHELRTPMTAIRGFSDLLLDSELDPADHDYVATIHRNADHLLAIINDILDLSRIEAGKLKIEPTSVCPGQLALDVDALLGDRARGRSLIWTASVEGAIPAEIVTDALRVRQIVVNLVANAIRHTEHGRVQLIVRMAGDAQIEFVVRDTGIGMSLEQLQQLFKPFSQVDTSSQRQREGTGLGLAICAKLAEALGGVIELESTVGEGTTATLRLPTGPLDGVPRWHNLRGTVTRPFGVASSGGFDGNVLVAEDDEDSERLIRAHLERAGLAVASVGDGALATTAALAAVARGEPYDVILMDMRMPNVDGYSATRELRASGYGGKIIAVTASAMAGDRDRCLAAGCDDYLSKPIDKLRLLDLVTTQLAASG